MPHVAGARRAGDVLLALLRRRLAVLPVAISHLHRRCTRTTTGCTATSTRRPATSGTRGYAAFQAHGDETRTYATSLSRRRLPQVGMMGKYLNGYTATRTPIPPGWDEWDVAGPAAYPEYNYTLNQNGIQVQYGHQPGRLPDVGAVAPRRRHHQPGHRRQQQARSRSRSPRSPRTCRRRPAPQFAHSFPNLRAPHGPAWDRLPTEPTELAVEVPAARAHRPSRTSTTSTAGACSPYSRSTRWSRTSRNGCVPITSCTTPTSSSAPTTAITPVSTACSPGSRPRSTPTSACR